MRLGMPRKIACLAAPFRTRAARRARCPARAGARPSRRSRVTVERARRRRAPALAAHRQRAVRARRAAARHAGEGRRRARRRDAGAGAAAGDLAGRQRALAAARYAGRLSQPRAGSSTCASSRAARRRRRRRCASTESDDGVAVDTGVIRFTVPKKRFAILDALRRAGRRSAASTGALSAVLVAGERRGEAQPPTRIARHRERARCAPASSCRDLRQRLRLPGSPRGLRRPAVRARLAHVHQSLSDPVRQPAAHRPGAAAQRPASGALPLRRRPTPRRAAGSLRDGLELFQVDNETHQVDGAAGRRPAGRLDRARRAGRDDRPRVALVLAGVSAEHRGAPRPPRLQPVGAAGRSRQGRRRRRQDARVRRSGSRRRSCVAAGRRRGAGHAAARRRRSRPRRAQRRAAAGAVAARRERSASSARRSTAARRYAARNATEVWDDCGAVRCDEAGLERTAHRRLRHVELGRLELPRLQGHHQGDRQLGQPRVRHGRWCWRSPTRRAATPDVHERWSRPRATSSTSTPSTPARRGRSGSA